MQYRQLGQTDLQVSTIAMGCWAIVGDRTWGPQDEADSIATIQAAFDAGINFFDTAEGYGNGYSEQVLGKALASRRGETIIASKVSTSNLAPADVRAACERSLRNLDTDYIDLYQVHWPSREVPFADTMQVLLDLQKAGKIRHIGVSNFGVEDLPAMMAQGRIESNQLPYSLLWRTIEHGIRPLCVEHGISILPYSPLAQGLLTGKFSSADEVPEGRARTRLFSSMREQARHGETGAEAETFTALAEIRAISEKLGESMSRIALAWLLYQPGVTSVLAGARTPEQLLDNARAADVVLSDDTLTALDEATAPIKALMGANPDPWQPLERSRYR
jgi:aryl-alcohol dehydrogenase-like predicted oxidoreductase